MTWGAGERLGEYVLEAPLHTVAGGQWWRARHHALVDVEVALLVAETEDLRARLPSLARVQDAVRGEAVLPVRGVDPTHAPPFLALQLKAGEWLTERLQRGPCSPAEARLVLAGVCDALAALHGQGLAHGAVEVGSVHVGADGRVRLGLLGCGRLATAPAASAADDLRALSRLAFACGTGLEPAGVVGPADLAALPDWAGRLIRRCQGQDGGYGAVAEARADLDGAAPAPASGGGLVLRFIETPRPVAGVPPPAVVIEDTCGVRTPAEACAGRRCGLWRLFWFPPRAAGALVAWLAPPAAHLAWIGALAWGVHAWIASDGPVPSPVGTVTGGTAMDPETDRLVADLRRLVEGGDGAAGPAVARIEAAGARRPEALRRAIDRFGRELLAAPASWVRAFDRLAGLAPPTHALALAELERLCARLAQDHHDDAAFQARLDRFRRCHVGEDF